MSDIGWGIIGVPNGFQHISEGITANSAISAVDNRLCIEDYEKESLYAVIYDTAIVEGTNNRQLMVYFVQYNFSKETGKDRSGSFYGSYIALPGRVPVNLDCCKNIIDILNKLSDHNKSVYIENNKFVRDYTSIFEFPNLEKELEKVIKNTDKAKLPNKKIDNKKDIVVYANDPSEVFLNSIELYDIYSRIYISNNESYCRYIDEVSNTKYKELLDLKKESFDIVEARRIEQDRIERHKRELEEKIIREKEQAEREEQERIRVHKNNMKNLFQNLEESFFYCEKDGELDELIKEYKSGLRTDFGTLKGLSERLEGYVNFANNIANEIKGKKLGLDSEIIRLEGTVYQVNEEVASAVNAAEEQVNIIGHRSGTIQDSSLKRDTTSSKASRTDDSRDPYHHLNKNNNFSKNKVFWIPAGFILLIIFAFAIYYFFDTKTDVFKSEKNVLLSKSTAKPEEYNTAIQKLENANINNEADVLYDPVDIESTDEVYSPIINYSRDCDYNNNLFQPYALVEKDIMNSDNSGSMYVDIDIVSNVAESILSNEGNNTISEKDKGRFMKMLMDCNDKLNYKIYDSTNEGKNQTLVIQPDEEVRYIKVSSLK